MENVNSRGNEKIESKYILHVNEKRVKLRFAIGNVGI